MKQKTLKLMEKAISSAGRWTYLELANDSFQIEFEDVQLYKPNSKYSKHSSEIAIRLADNAFFNLFYNDIEDIKDIVFICTGDFSYDDFSYNILSGGLKFQNFEFSKKLLILIFMKKHCWENLLKIFQKETVIFY